MSQMITWPILDPNFAKYCNTVCEIAWTYYIYISQHEGDTVFYAVSDTGNVK